MKYADCSETQKEGTIIHIANGTRVSRLSKYLYQYRLRMYANIHGQDHLDLCKGLPAQQFPSARGTDVPD